MDLDAGLLLEQLTWHWDNAVRPRLGGLTDDEYRWEPVAGCWNVHPAGGSRTPPGAGTGGVIDFAFPEPDPPPVTTIAWRLAHVSVGVFGMRASNHFGDGSVGYDSTAYPLTAAGGLALLEQHRRAWVDGVAALTPAQLAEPCGPAEGDFGDLPMAALVLHISREAIHHLAEVALLRDLYRRRAELGR